MLLPFLACNSGFQNSHARPIEDMNGLLLVKSLSSFACISMNQRFPSQIVPSPSVARHPLLPLVEIRNALQTVNLVLTIGFSLITLPLILLLLESTYSIMSMCDVRNILRHVLTNLHFYLCIYIMFESSLAPCGLNTQPYCKQLLKP